VTRWARAGKVSYVAVNTPRSPLEGAAAELAAVAMARNAAETAAAIQVCADASALQQSEAASRAAAVVPAATRPGSNRDDALIALRLAAVV
jgi:hypothetical protein